MSAEPLDQSAIWDKLPNNLFYLTKFPGVSRFVRFQLGINGEIETSPETPIHTVNVLEDTHPHAIPTTIGWRMETAPTDSSSHLIIMDHAINLQTSGMSADSFHPGVLIDDKGTITHLFSKRQTPEGKKRVEKEVISYRLLQNYSTSGNKPGYLPPYFIPDTNDEIIMLDLAKAGFDESLASYLHSANLPESRRILLSVLRKTALLFDQCFMSGIELDDVVFAGKGIWIKDLPDNNFDVCLTDIGMTKKHAHRREIWQLLFDTYFKMLFKISSQESSEKELEPILTWFPYVVLVEEEDQKSVEITDPVFSRIVNAEGQSLSDLLTFLTKFSFGNLKTDEPGRPWLDLARYCTYALRDPRLNEATMCKKELNLQSLLTAMINLGGVNLFKRSGLNTLAAEFGLTPAEFTEKFLELAKSLENKEPKE